MRCQLHPSLRLEGWPNMPYNLCDAEHGFELKIKRDDLMFLLQCDGKTEIGDDQKDMAEAYAAHGYIRILEEGQEVECEAPSYELHPYHKRNNLQLAITGRCNLRCRHCLAAADENNNTTQLSLNDCKKIFADMKEARIPNLWITGGEPMIHPQFMDILQAAADAGLRVSQIFTNAMRLTPEMLDQIEAIGLKPEFVVSFDGIGTHDWMRRREGAEEKALAAVDMLRARGYRVKIGIQVNSVSAPNIIDSCRTLIREHDVSCLHPIFTSPTPRWFKQCEGKPVLQIDEYYELMLQLLETSFQEKWNVPLDIIHLPHAHLSHNLNALRYLHEPPAPMDKRKIMNSCGRATDTVFCASDGRILPCSTYEGESIHLGILQGDDINILKTPLTQILAKSEYTETYDYNIGQLREDEPGCRDCKWVTVCCGGCPLYTKARRYWDCGNPICRLYTGGYAEKYAELCEKYLGKEEHHHCGCGCEDHGHEQHHEHGEHECKCGHHHEHGEHCECGDDCECKHEHHHEHDHECKCGHHHEHHHE